MYPIKGARSQQYSDLSDKVLPLLFTATASFGKTAFASSVRHLQKATFFIL